MSDLLLLATLGVVATFIAAVVMTVPPGAWPRYVRGRRYHRRANARHTAGWLDAHDVPADKRGLPADVTGEWMLADFATTPVPALTTVPDGGPFAPKAA